MPTPVIVTTSWDDGPVADLRMAELLAAHGLPATFYVPIKGHHASERISSSDLRAIAMMDFEIGAHGVSHPDLTLCTPAGLKFEVEASGQQLEDELGLAVRMFAYPQGRLNKRVLSAVECAGYCGARTTRMLARGIYFDPFQMPTSVQAYPHSTPAYLRNLVRSFSIVRTAEYLSRLQQSRNWVQLAKALFDAVMHKGGIWHLYGHSWEVEEMQLWNGLEEIFSYVAQRPGVLYLSNSKVLSLAPQESRASSLAGSASASRRHSAAR